MTHQTAHSKLELEAEGGVRAPPAADGEGAAHARRRIDELAQLVEAYNQVTVNLQASHETLTAEVQRLQKQLASANAALQRSKRLAALGEMAAGIAHEVRNPLASIHLYADMLRSDLAEQPPQQDLAKQIAAAVRGLDAIVNDVLSFSREMRVRKTAARAADVLERAAAAVGPLLDANGVHVRIAGEDVTLHVDLELMQQALVNLVRNAADAMPDGGTLRLSAAVEDGATQIAVADSGAGISKQDVDRIFNPFFTTRATGTGLGLAIVHRIVDAHGGSIAVTNEVEGGACFTLCLPVGEGDDTADEGDAA